MMKPLKCLFYEPRVIYIVFTNVTWKINESSFLKCNVHSAAEYLLMSVEYAVF